MCEYLIVTVFIPSMILFSLYSFRFYFFIVKMEGSIFVYFVFLFLNNEL